MLIFQLVIFGKVLLSTKASCTNCLPPYHLNRQKPERLKALLEREQSNENELEWLELLGLPFFVELSMRETFPDLQETMEDAVDAVNPYEELVSDRVATETKVKFLRLARRCLKIDTKFRTKALNLETLLCRKYFSRAGGGSGDSQTDNRNNGDFRLEEVGAGLENNDKYKVFDEIVFEVEKRCGMQW